MVNSHNEIHTDSHLLESNKMTENLIEGAAPAAPASPAPVATEESTLSAPVAVSDNLFSSLGLDKVDADPNAVPDGRYDAVVRSADMVYIKSKNKVSIVINYQVEGDYAPAQLAQFQDLGINPVVEDGKIKSFTPTMSEQNKRFLKKAFVDLGISEAQVETLPTRQLLQMVVGRKCIIGVKKNGNFRNVSYVEYRAPEVPTDLSAVSAASAQAVTSDDPFTATNTPAPAAPVSEEPAF